MKNLPEIKQHKVVAYIKLMVEITLDEGEDTDTILEGIASDINRGLCPDSRAVIGVDDTSLYSDELVRG